MYAPSTQDPFRSEGGGGREGRGCCSSPICVFLSAHVLQSQLPGTENTGRDGGCHPCAALGEICEDQRGMRLRESGRERETSGVGGVEH